MGFQLTEGMLLRICWLLRIRRPLRPRRADDAPAARPAMLPRLGALLCALLGSNAALAYNLDVSYEDLHLGLTAGVAIACGTACAVAWAATRNAIYGAGLAFMLLEGIFRSMPALLPPAALQAGSYAALLALTAFCGASVLWITAFDMRARGTSGRMRPVRTFDIAIGLALLVPSLYAFWRIAGPLGLA